MESLSTRGKQLLILCVVACAGLMAIIVALAATSTQALEKRDKLDATLDAMSAQGLSVGAVSLTDMYGEEYVAAGILCPNMNSGQVAQTYGVAEDQLGFEGTISEDENYLLLGREDGTVSTRHFDRSDLDLCVGGTSGQVFATSALVAVVKTPEGGWQILA